MAWFWVSVAGIHSGRFKGVMILESEPEALEALAQTTYAAGGGDTSECLDVQVYGPLTDDALPLPEWRNRLLNKAQAEEHLDGESTLDNKRKAHD